MADFRFLRTSFFLVHPVSIYLSICADNPVFLETERLIARCIHRQAAEVDLDLDLGGEEQEKEVEQEMVQVTSAPDPDLSRLLRPAPVSTCPSPASSEGGVYTSVSLSYLYRKSLSEIVYEGRIRFMWMGFVFGIHDTFTSGFKK